VRSWLERREKPVTCAVTGWRESWRCDEESCGVREGWGALVVQDVAREDGAPQGGETAGAEPDVAPGEVEQLLLPRPLRSRRGRGHAEPLAGDGELGGGVEADGGRTDEACRSARRG